MGRFYSKLYTSSKKNIKDIKEYINNVTFDKVLSPNQKAELEKMPTLDEFTNILPQLKENRSPGLDGLSIEFFKTFWIQLSPLYFEMVNEAWSLEILPFSTRTSVLSTIHKANARNNLKNYRPLSLTNIDYKLIAFVFSERLQKVIGSIISPDQVAYIKDRYIGTSVRNLIDLYDFCENYNAPGAFICADLEKAFDSIELEFLYCVLEKFNFGNNFIKWMKIMYNQANFKVKNNGWLSKHYMMERGLRQGDPMSAILFIIVLEVLSQMVRNHTDVKGILIGNKAHKIVQYADDRTFCICDLNSIDTIMHIISEFSNFAGPKINVTKAKGIWLGPLKENGLEYTVILYGLVNR